MLRYSELARIWQATQQLVQDDTQNLIQRLKFEKAIKLPERDAVELCREAIAIGKCQAHFVDWRFD